MQLSVNRIPSVQKSGEKVAEKPNHDFWPLDSTKPLENQGVSAWVAISYSNHGALQGIRTPDLLVRSSTRGMNLREPESISEHLFLLDSQGFSALVPYIPFAVKEVV